MLNAKQNGDLQLEKKHSVIFLGQALIINDRKEQYF